MSKARGVLAPAVILDGFAAHNYMERLSKVEHPVTDRVFHRIHSAWTLRGAQREITLALTPTELRVFKKLGATTKPVLVEYRYLAIYRHPELDQEVRVRSQTRPPKRRTFRVPGNGNRKFSRIKLYAITTKESSTTMAKKNTKTAKNKKAAAVEDAEEVDDLEGLDELDELEDDDVEEPEAEVDEDEEEDEEEEPAPKRRKRKTATKTVTKSKRKKAAPVVEEDDEEDEDEEDEEDDEPVVTKKKSKKSKATAKSNPGTKTKKKNKASKGGDGNSAAGRTTAELTGGVGTAELAEAASEIAEVEITGREVRVYLRQNDIPKDEEHKRYVWPSDKNKKFQKLARDIAAHYGEDEE